MSAPEGLGCFLCGASFGDIKKLKFHLVLAHPKAHTCLFCIERKGWSSEFPSQVAYNQHYQELHSGVIEVRAEERQVRRRKRRARQALVREEGLTMRDREVRACSHCPPHSPAFESGYQRDRHLVSHHHYDVCRLCRLVGPGMEVMVHTAMRHPAQLCHLCGSQSPLFSGRERVRGHMENIHGSPGYFCPNCDDQPFPSLQTWLAHFQAVHHCSGEDLRPVKRKRVRGAERSDDCEGISTVCGLRNDSHFDCHILGVLHLLAQTGLPELLDTSDQTASELRQFFQTYSAGGSFFPHQVLRSPASFGATTFPDLPGDLLSLFLGCCPAARAYSTVIEWRFECLKCSRFVKMRLDDFVFRIKATEAGSLEHHLNGFLTAKSCSCGASCPVEPVVKAAGHFLFVELDRSAGRQVSSTEHEVALYPLKLQKKYNILGADYTVFATINLNLEYAEGGHYTTNLLLDGDEIIRIHEDSVVRQPTGPTFDSTTVVVALRNDQRLAQRGEERGSGAPVYDLNKQNGDGSVTGKGGLEGCSSNRPVNETKHEQSEEEAEEEEGEEEEEEGPVGPAGSRSPLPSHPLPASKENIMLLGDNMRIYLNDDQEVVNRYRRKYESKVEEQLREECESAPDVSLRSLGGQVLASKVYRVQSLGGSKKRRKKLQEFQPGRIDHDGGVGEANTDLALIVPEEVGQLR